MQSVDEWEGATIRTTSTALKDKRRRNFPGFKAHCIQIEPLPMVYSNGSWRSMFDEVAAALSAAGTKPSFLSFYPSFGRHRGGNRKMGRAIVRFEDQGDVFRAIHFFDGQPQSAQTAKYLAVDPFVDAEGKWCWVRIENVPQSMTEEMLTRGIEHNGFAVEDVVMMRSALCPPRAMVRCGDHEQAMEIAAKMNGSNMDGHTVWSIVVRGFSGTNAGDADEGVPCKRVLLYPVPYGCVSSRIEEICEKYGEVKEALLASSNRSGYPSHAVVVMSTVEEAQSLSEGIEGEEIGECRLRTVHLRMKEWEIKKREADREVINIEMGIRKKPKLKLTAMQKNQRRRGYGLGKILRKEKKFWSKWKRQIYWPSIKGPR